ncbi:anti-sigma-D factor RsdA [Mycolicibacterium sp. XJ1819]
MPDFGRWTSNGGDPSLNEINRTDRFLDALAFEQPVYSTDPGEAELAHLLAGWRDEVRDAPLTAALTPRDAVLALDGARASRRRGRMTLAVVGSAAAAVLCLGGFVSVVAGAGPGDSLYGLKTMFFGEQQASRDDAVMLASQQLAEVQQLIEEGQWDAAEQKLQTLTTTVASVNDVERKEELVTQWQELTVKVESKDANATVPPGAPLPQMPDVPVVVAPGTDTSAITTVPLETTTATPPSETTVTSPPPSETTLPSSPTETTLPSSPTETTLPSSPAETSQIPRPTPSQTPQPSSPTLLPAPSPTVVPTPTPTPTPKPTSQAPLPTPSAVTPQPTPSAVQEDTQEDDSTAEAPTREAPRTAVTTTVVLPEPADEPR